MGEGLVGQRKWEALWGKGKAGMARTGLWNGVSCYMHTNSARATLQSHGGRNLGSLHSHNKRRGMPGTIFVIHTVFPSHLNQKNYPGPLPENPDSRAFPGDC